MGLSEYHLVHGGTPLSVPVSISRGLVVPIPRI